MSLSPVIFAFECTVSELIACGAGLIGRRMEGIYKKSAAGARRKVILPEFESNWMRMVEMSSGSEICYAAVSPWSTCPLVLRG